MGDEIERLKALEQAVIKVVTQRGDNLCWRDAYTELAGLVGIEFCPELLETKEQFLANCNAFDCSLRTGGEYKPVFVERSESIQARLKAADTLSDDLQSEMPQLEADLHYKALRVLKASLADYRDIQEQQP